VISDTHGNRRERQSRGLEAARIRAIGGFAACAGARHKKTSAQNAKNLKSGDMRMRRDYGMTMTRKKRRGGTAVWPRFFTSCPAALAAVLILSAQARIAEAQMMPGGAGGPGGPGGRGGVPAGGGMPDEIPSSSSSSEKPDLAAKKAYKAAMKALDKAKGLEADAAATSNPDKKAKDMEKVGDQYNAALDAFTEALSNKSDMVEAWDQVGYVHLRLGAYREAIDDYNHTLALKPELMEAIEHRAEAYLATDRLEDVRSAYMDLFNHAPDLASQLMAAMQKWLTAHQTDPRGMRAGDIEAFGKWMNERDGIAKQTASLPH
jgi:hypothetical protein